MVLIRFAIQPVRFSSTVARITRVPSKFNNTSSASNVKPNYKPGLHHHPSPSVARVETPDVFLPAGDVRKGMNLSGKPPVDISTAPALSTPAPQKLNLTPTDVNEIQNLRNSDPERWTRKRLAEKFGVSPFTISLVSNVNAERDSVMQANLDTIKGSWSDKRRRARNDRQKRKVAWYRDE